MTDLECLDAAAEHARRFGTGITMFMRGGDVGRGLALIDAALVRWLREWDGARADGNGRLIAALGVVAEAMLPKLGREARRILGR